MLAAEFRPQPGLRNRHLQSMLASSRLRRWLFEVQRHRLQREQRELVLDCGAGVRLAGLLTLPEAEARALVVLLHGWEGSASSNYMLHTGGRLLDAGFAVFRLNFRDHGQTHHLNTELFHSCRLDEVVGAVAELARRLSIRPLLLAGYSLGGNFALRVALRAPAAALPLAGVVAVCPVIDPASSLHAIESAPFVYQRYFLRKWRRSLERKQALYPDRYRFSRWPRSAGLRELTRRMVLEHTDFGSLEAYLDGYSIAGDRLGGLAVPTHILTAEDDPVIPVADFHRLRLPASARLTLARFGGHCGFIDDYRGRGWAEQFVTRTLLGQLEGGPGS